MAGRGPEAGLGTFVLVGFADAYWAWQFAWEATRPSLTLAASAVVLYLVVWCPLYRKAGRALGHPGKPAADCAPPCGGRWHKSVSF